jgi:transposase-like protein
MDKLRKYQKKLEHATTQASKNYYSKKLDHYSKNKIGGSIKGGVTFNEAQEAVNTMQQKMQENINNCTSLLQQATQEIVSLKSRIADLEQQLTDLTNATKGELQVSMSDMSGYEQAMQQLQEQMQQQQEQQQEQQQQEQQQ